MSTYTVKQGDSLSRIALQQLGDESRWRDIAALNDIADPDLIYIGQRLELPDASMPAPWGNDDWPPQPAPTTPALQPPSQAGFGAGGPPWFPLLIIGVGALLFLGNRR